MAGEGEMPEQSPYAGRGCSCKHIRHCGRDPQCAAFTYCARVRCRIKSGMTGEGEMPDKGPTCRVRLLLQTLFVIAGLTRNLY